jgi:hypothetical protein
LPTLKSGEQSVLMKKPSSVIFEESWLSNFFDKLVLTYELRLNFEL